MKKILIALVIFTLSGCHLIDLKREGAGKSSPEGSSETVVISPDEQDPATVITTPAKKVDWPMSLESMTEKIVQAAPINKADLLLVANINNNSNIELNISTLTAQLKQVISSTKRFTVVPESSLVAARVALGLQEQDSLNTRSKTIGLARYLTIPYVFYTTIEGQDITLTLSSQIMQVESGELIWSEKIPVSLSEQ